MHRNKGNNNNNNNYYHNTNSYYINDFPTRISQLSFLVTQGKGEVRGTGKSE